MMSEAKCYKTKKCTIFRMIDFSVVKFIKLKFVTTDFLFFFFV